jgi:hypothetical protein
MPSPGGPRAERLTQGRTAARFEKIQKFSLLWRMVAHNHWEKSVMAEWKAPIPERKSPGLREALGRATAKINIVIAILVIFGLFVAADAYLHAFTDFAMRREHPTFAQELREELSISFIGSGIGLAFGPLWPALP